MFAMTFKTHVPPGGFAIDPDEVDTFFEHYLDVTLDEMTLEKNILTIRAKMRSESLCSALGLATDMARHALDHFCGIEGIPDIAALSVRPLPATPQHRTSSAVAGRGRG